MVRALLARACPAVVVAVLIASAVPASSDALVTPDTVVHDVRLPSISGGTERVFGEAKVHVLVFFRPGDRSLETLRELASCEKDLRSRSVRVVGLVSSSIPAEESAAFVR